MAKNTTDVEPGVFERNDNPRADRLKVAAVLGLAATVFSFKEGPWSGLILVQMLYYLLYRSDLRLDTRQRTYRRAVGVIPFLHVRRGSVDEICGLELEVTGSRKNRLGGEGYSLSLNFRSDASCIQVHATTDFDELSKMAAQLSCAFDWPIVEGPLLRKQRSILVEVPFELPTGKP